MTDVETTVAYNNLKEVSLDESVAPEKINIDHPESENISQNNSATDNANIVSTEKNITPVDQTAPKKRLNLIDSDSENESVSVNSNPKSTEPETVNENLNNVANKIESDNETVEPIITKVNKNRLTLIDSDSEDDENADAATKVANELEIEESAANYASHHENVNKRMKKRLNLINSDSESEEINLNLKSNENNEDNTGGEETSNTNDNQTTKKKSRLLQLYDSDSEDEIKTITLPKSDKSVTTMTFQTDVDVEQQQTIRRLKTLCDSESSAEETEEHITKDNIIKQKRIKKRVEPTEKKMTGKEALEQRRQIKSESQKMTRESRVHLPYHRPKQHTLQEFLKRRSLVNLKAPPNTPTSLSIKMGNKELKTADLKLKAREKEIEEFYKSESEAEEEPEPVKVEETKNETQVINENDFSLKENSAKKLETEVENPEQMEIDSAEQQEKLVEEQIKSNKDLQPETSKEILDEKVSEEVLQENSEDKITVEQMEVDSEEKSPNKEINCQTNDNEINVDKSLEPDQIEDEFSTYFKETNEEKEAKLKELREILEKNLANTQPESPSTENMEEKQTEPNNTELNKAKEATQIVENKAYKLKKISEIEEKLKKLNPVTALKGNLHPRLSGGPNELIVLDDDIEKSKRVTNLMQRFLKHTTKKTVHKTTELSILNVEKGVLNKETITLIDDEDVDDEPAKKIQIPGIKMKKLKIELEDQIIKKRLEEWKKRQEEIKLDNEEYDGTYTGEKENCGGLGNKMLDNEEEEELTESSSSESEEEEEDDIVIKEKPRIKSAFVDEEAEESNEDDDEEALENNEYEGDDEDEDEESEETNDTKKPHRRIIKPADDSDDESSNQQRKMSIEELLSQTPRKHSTWDDNDDDIPAYQPPSEGLEKTPCKSATQSKNDFSTFLSPTLHLTALQGMNSASKSLSGSPNVNSFLPPEPSPLKSKSFIKTKLFADQQSVNDNNLDELEDLCSGKFITQVENKTDKLNDNLSTQENELFNICSGNFSGLTQNESLPIKVTQSFESLNNEESQNFKLTENETITDSQLLKLSFDDETSNQENINPQDNIINPPKFSKMVIASSSEDEDKENESTKKKNLKKMKRKYVIDDISITDDDEFEEDKLQEVDLEDEEENAHNIDYDSEENEIEFDEEEIDKAKKQVYKASDFFEAEAELSESEWGSADEDENNLDDYEVEEADGEKINEKKVQRELERMHMRNILDKDQREVQMLQELLLEDGELHGAGRERKFRWKNADSLSWNTTTDTNKPKEEEEEECEELESELQWRKMRHERETFLKEQQTMKKSEQRGDEDDVTNYSQIMQLGQQSLRKFSIGSQNSSQKKTPVAESLSKTDDIKLPFTLAIKRGSFLQRSDRTLARLAEITRVTGSLNGPKNSKNFVFTSVEKTDIVEDELNAKKRKAEEGTPKVLKKLRIADMSPNVQKRKKKLNLS